jgi:hypothetical protein
MQQPPTVAQNHAVGNVPDQHVVEGIALRQSGARAAHQPRLAELGESVQQWLFREPRHACEQLECEFAADHGCGLNHLSHAVKPVNARCERGIQCRGDSMVGQLRNRCAYYRHSIVPIGLDHGTRQLLYK